MASIIICDICDSRKDVSTQHYKTGVWQSDPAGGRSEEDFDSYDLCVMCELKILRLVFKELNNKKVITEKLIIDDIKRRLNLKK